MSEQSAMPDKIKAALKKTGASEAEINEAVSKALALIGGDTVSPSNLPHDDLFSDGAAVPVVKKAKKSKVTTTEDLFNALTDDEALTPADKSMEIAPVSAIDKDAIKATAAAAEMLSAKLDVAATIKAERKAGSLGSPRTQKARGVMFLSNHVHSDLHQVPAYCVYGPPSGTVLMPYQMPQGAGPWFARPCPERPRHGFVDSRSVSNFEQLLDLWAETQAVDQNAEVLIMPRCTAEISAVACNASVVWGRGNDGATGGKSSSVTIPASCDPEKWRKQVCSKWFYMSDNGVSHGITDTPYLEIVEDKGASRCVQMRDGPAQTAARDYVPSAGYKVEAILKLENEPELLKWEAAVASLKGKIGACVWGAGVPLSSHYAVHAITNGVAFYAGADDPTGKVLEPQVPAVAPLTDKELKVLGAHLSAWMTRPLLCKSIFGMYCGQSGQSEHYQARFQMSALLTAISVLHSQHMWAGDVHLLGLRAFGAAIFARFFAGSCIGEARHFYRAGPGKKGHRQSTLNWEILGWKANVGTFKHDMPSRDSVYKRCFDKPFGEIRSLLKGAHKDFAMRGWASQESGGEGGDSDENDVKSKNYGFGGPKWRDSALVGVNLMDAINAFVLYPVASNWAEVVSHMNVAVNCAHNGGFILDKWTSKESMDRLAVAPGLGFLNSVAGFVALNSDI